MQIFESSNPCDYRNYPDSITLPWLMVRWIKSSSKYASTVGFLLVSRGMLTTASKIYDRIQ